MMFISRILTIIGVTFLMYAQTLKYRYVIDDIGATQRKRTGKWWKDFWGEIRGRYYFNPPVEHLISTVIHTINCCLIFVVFGRSTASFIAALLFSVNPSNNQGAVWLSGKGYSISAMFVLLSLLFVQLFPIFYTIPLVASMGSAILSPLLFIKLKPHYLIVCLPLIVLITHQYYATLLQSRLKESTTLMKKIDLTKLVVVFRTYAYYFVLALFPVRLGMYHKFNYTLGLTKEEHKQWIRMDKWFWLGVGLMYVFVTNFFWNYNEGVYGWFWFTLFIAQWTDLVVINQPIAERFLYLPNMGMMYMLASLILSLPHSTIVFTCFFVAYVVRLFYYLPAYQTNNTLFKYNVENFPDFYNAYNSYGADLLLSGRFGMAIDIWLEGLKYRPKDFKLNVNIAGALAHLGNYKDALTFYLVGKEGANVETQETQAIVDIDKKIEKCREMIGETKDNPTPVVPPSPPQL